MIQDAKVCFPFCHESNRISHGGTRLWFGCPSHCLIRRSFDRDLSEAKTRREQGRLNFIFISISCFIFRKDRTPEGYIVTSVCSPQGCGLPCGSETGGDRGSQRSKTPGVAGLLEWGTGEPFPHTTLEESPSALEAGGPCELEPKSEFYQVL